MTEKIYDRLIQLLLALAIGIGGWALVKAVEHETRISVIESRYSESQRIQQTLLDAVVLKLDAISHEVRMNRECLIRIDAGKGCTMQ